MKIKCISYWQLFTLYLSLHLQRWLQTLLCVMKSFKNKIDGERGGNELLQRSLLNPLYLSLSNSLVLSNISLSLALLWVGVVRLRGWGGIEELCMPPVFFFLFSIAPATHDLQTSKLFLSHFLHSKKKWSHFDLKSWVTGRTKVRPKIPSN